MSIICTKNSIVNMAKSSVYIVLMALNFVFLVSCGSDNPIQRDNVESANNSYKQCNESYCGRGQYIAYDKRDIIIGEINGNPSIYFSNMEMEQGIIYSNPECYGIYDIVLEREWIYFTERFGKTRDNMKHYISCVKVDGTGYRKIKECQARMLCVYAGNLYYKNNDTLKYYDVVKKTEKEITDYVSEFCYDDGKLYLFNYHNKEAIVIDIETGETTMIDRIFRKPIVRKNEIYYIRDKSEDDAFREDDVYYICKKGVDSKEEILYSTTDYVFSFVVLDESILVSQGTVNDSSELWEQKVDDISNRQAKLIQVQLGNSKETVIREDLSYGTEIYSTLNKLYFSIEKWNGKRWIYHDESLALNTRFGLCQ